jgi:hypothetical protein
MKGWGRRRRERERERDGQNLTTETFIRLLGFSRVNGTATILLHSFIHFGCFAQKLKNRSNL